MSWWILAGLLVVLAACVLTAPPVRCRYGWHSWQRRPELVDDSLLWSSYCASCDPPLESLRGVAE